jgi:hypothetical protein
VQYEHDRSKHLASVHSMHEQSNGDLHAWGTEVKASLSDSTRQLRDIDVSSYFMCVFIDDRYASPMKDTD